MDTQTTEERPRRRGAKNTPAALEHALPLSTPPARIFASWREMQRDAGNMNQKSLEKYASLWKGWRSWLVRQRLRMRDITAQDLKRFLEGPAPSRTPRHRPLNGASMSANTRARYYHLIDSVYSLCLYPSNAGENPTRQLERKNRILEKKALEPQLLDKTVFDALRDARQIRATIHIDPKQDHRWWLMRDRAIMAVLADTGLTASEVCKLKRSDLYGPGLDLTPGQLLLEGIDAEVRVQLENPLNKKGRNLPLSSGKSRLMLEWLHRREQLLRDKAALLGTAAARERFLAEHLEGGPVFFAKPRSNDEGVFKPIRPDSLYYVVHTALADLRKRLGVPAEQGARADGPAVIRNTLIQYWVNHYSAERAAEMAGYADEASLRVTKQTQGKK